MSALDDVNTLIETTIVPNNRGAITAPVLQADLLAITSLFNNTFFSSLITTFLTGLPTALPAAPGVIWNNGGVISIS